ncbi:hypothetical protein ACSS6W_000643 [Trichoderma asperelloides]
MIPPQRAPRCGCLLGIRSKASSTLALYGLKIDPRQKPGCVMHGDAVSFYAAAVVANDLI